MLKTPTGGTRLSKLGLVTGSSMVCGLPWKQSRQLSLSPQAGRVEEEHPHLDPPPEGEGKTNNG